MLTKGEHMHNTEYEKYPTSGEENVEVDVHWPIQDAYAGEAIKDSTPRPSF